MLVSHRLNGCTRGRGPGRTLGLVLLAATAAGCSSWPRYANLPEGQGDVASDVDPRTLDELFGLDWQAHDESGENDLPTGAQEAEFALGTAYLVTGTLDGLGWYDQAVPQQASSEECDSSGSRSPLDEGDYIGDVDFYIVAPQVDATLCTRALLDQGSYGWDLLLFELDACDIPTGVVLEPDGEILGWGGGGTTGEWAHVVTAGSRYGVLVAGYYPNELETTLDYTIGVSLVASRSDGTAGLCPLLPGEGGQE